MHLRNLVLISIIILILLIISYSCLRESFNDSGEICGSLVVESFNNRTPSSSSSQSQTSPIITVYNDGPNYQDLKNITMITQTDAINECKSNPPTVPEKIKGAYDRMPRDGTSYQCIVGGKCRVCKGTSCRDFDFSNIGICRTWCNSAGLPDAYYSREYIDNPYIENDTTYKCTGSWYDAKAMDMGMDMKRTVNECCEQGFKAWTCDPIKKVCLPYKKREFSETSSHMYYNTIEECKADCSILSQLTFRVFYQVYETMPANITTILKSNTVEGLKKWWGNGGGPPFFKCGSKAPAGRNRKVFIQCNGEGGELYSWFIV